MTCIVGIVENGDVVIGGDSIGVKGTTVRHREDSKVFRLDLGEEEMIIGFTDSFRMGQIIEYQLPYKLASLLAFDMLRIKELAFERMVKTFIPALRKLFKEHGFMRKFDDGSDRGGTFLVGFRGRLFYIGENFQVGESKDGYEAIGSGHQFALGALYGVIKKKEVYVNERISIALNAASHHCTTVGGKYNIETLEGER